MLENKPPEVVVDTKSQKPEATRSSRWPTVRKKHVLKYNRCAACGGTTKLEVHHIKPFHLFPELELDPSNLLTLCDENKGGHSCHLLFGHLGNFKSYNTTVVEDSAYWLQKFQTRPLE